MSHPISIIVAMANGNAIGFQNKLLCHIPGDLKRFRELTLWHPVIMGRKTWESLPKKPLPGRINIILSKNMNYKAQGAYVVQSPEAALALCEPEKEVFIVGGAEIYKIFLPLASRLYITRIYEDFPADTFFPALDLNQWKLIAQEDHPEDETNSHHYTYLTYIRIS